MKLVWITLLHLSLSLCSCSVSDVDPVTAEVEEAPEAFTPNGDSINDVFRVTSTMNFDLYQLEIFNPSNVLVFENGQP